MDTIIKCLQITKNCYSGDLSTATIEYSCLLWHMLGSCESVTQIIQNLLTSSCLNDLIRTVRDVSMLIL